MIDRDGHVLKYYSPQPSPQTIYHISYIILALLNLVWRVQGTSIGDQAGHPGLAGRQRSGLAVSCFKVFFGGKAFAATNYQPQGTS